MISQDEFAALAAQGYNRIPVVREVLSDLDTPLSVYSKFADAPYTYLLESGNTIKLDFENGRVTEIRK